MFSSSWQHQKIPLAINIIAGYVLEIPCALPLEHHGLGAVPFADTAVGAPAVCAFLHLPLLSPQVSISGTAVHSDNRSQLGLPSPHPQLFLVPWLVWQVKLLGGQSRKTWPKVFVAGVSCELTVGTDDGVGLP